MKCKKIESKSELLSLQGLNVSTREDRFGFDFCRFTAIYTQILETHGNSWICVWMLSKIKVSAKQELLKILPSMGIINSDILKVASWGICILIWSFCKRNTHTFKPFCTALGNHGNHAAWTQMEEVRANDIYAMARTMERNKRLTDTSYKERIPSCPKQRRFRLI